MLPLVLVYAHAGQGYAGATDERVHLDRAAEPRGLPSEGHGGPLAPAPRGEPAYRVDVQIAVSQ